MLTACNIVGSNKSIKYSKTDVLIAGIVDGDTIDVYFPGETKKKRIRILGIQAMETHTSVPNTNKDCWADEATKRLEELTGGKGAIVILRSKNPKVEIRDRLARHVYIIANGEEINISEKLLSEGLVFPFLHFTENTHNEEYMQAAEEAKKNHLGLWDSTNHCETKADSYDVDFELKLHVDATGYDKRNLKGEWVKVTNKSGREVNISGWWLRDSALHFFRFPSDTVLENNETITVYGGKGKERNNTYYWGNKKPIFDNHAEGVYLHDYLSPDNCTSLDYELCTKGNIKSSVLYMR